MQGLVTGANHITGEGFKRHAWRDPVHQMGQADGAKPTTEGVGHAINAGNIGGEDSGYRITLAAASRKRAGRQSRR